MHELRRGIILKDRNVIAKGLSENECHSDLLEELKIEDNYKNSVSLFVKAELISPNELRTDTDNWEFVINQKEVPDWFIMNREKYEASFRHDVKLVEFYSGFRNCKVKLQIDNSIVEEIHDNAVVKNISDNLVSSSYKKNIPDNLVSSSRINIRRNMVKKGEYNE